MIPTDVLEQLKSELLDWQKLGTSAFEISHRSKDYMEKILEPAEANLRKLLHIPENYHVLFTSLGTSHHFGMIPLNFLDRKNNNSASYIQSGIWSGKAIKEAQRYGDISVSNFDSPRCNPESSYLHYTPNETIEGLQIHHIPDSGSVPLIADMSSEILSKNIDIHKYGLIYAGAQKNIGPSGLSIVIMRDDLIGHAKAITPTLYNYQTYVDSKSLYNTPNTFAIYLAGLVFEWLLKNGGVEEISIQNTRKANKLYDYIDKTDFYNNKVEQKFRSQMNIVFNTPNADLDAVFVEKSAEQHLINLKGHKAVGGLRASIYNAMPESGVDALIDFMKDFEKSYG
ncbi:MAG TPA: 3-phosphoserine/phosphohydroxythreonine transaminase [Gammaproteobacteria bacterium]|nr:3-phosphoserine/phosphohydroxythreonine transaminase [Gammaproteobacteria bacterium]